MWLLLSNEQIVVGTHINYNPPVYCEVRVCVSAIITAHSKPHMTYTTNYAQF